MLVVVAWARVATGDRIVTAVGLVAVGMGESSFLATMLVALFSSFRKRPW